MRGSWEFCQSYLVLILFYSLERGPMVLLLKKLYFYFTKDPEGSIIFQGGVKLFPGGGGPNANFFRNPCTMYVLVIFKGVSGPLSPSGSAHGQCHHNGTIFILVPLLTIVVRH